MTRHVPQFDLSRILRDTSVQHVEYHPTLTSTSTVAAELLGPLLKQAPSLVLTEEQTAGRGRKGNLWWSTAGALTFSLVLKASEVPMAAERRPLIALAAGLAVRTALAELAPGFEFFVKWPNDVLTGAQKICGILVEQQGADDQQGLIIGIGINVNNSLREAPAEVAQRATSLFDLCGQSFELTDTLIRVLQQLDFRISQFVTQPRLALSEVNRFSLLSGRTVTVLSGDVSMTGHCIGIDEDGQLVLQTEQGLVRCSTGIVQQW